MTNKAPTILNPLTLPIHGRRLIEASAGTGKTYTISGLYLRLLLGHGDIDALKCEQILVVTFTNAATEELRGRIRNRISLCYQRFLGLPINDEFIEQLYQDCEPIQRKLALKQLDLALQSFDQASILTIHGFCQRILADMAFEAALLFESDFILDDSQFLAQSVRDFWRQTCYQLPQTFATAIKNTYNTPDDLGRELRPLLGANQAGVITPPQDFQALLSQITLQISRLKLAWKRERQRLEVLLHQLPLNGVRYGKQDDGYPKLTALFNDMDNWVKYEHGLPQPNLLEKLSLSELKLKKGGIPPTPEQAPLLAQIEQLKEALTQFIPAFIYQARNQINHIFHQSKVDHNLMSPDDLLMSLAQAINATTHNNSVNDISAQLANKISQRFPVALIDEFQDTDPLQYSIFSNIYPQQSVTSNSVKAKDDSQCLLMIGDPKQAIYAFRGADIFTYISARTQTPAQYNLGVNYRSSSLMVDAVNRLFNNHDDPFINAAIPFTSVNAADKGDKHIISHTTEQPALFLRLLAEDPDKGLNKTNARKILAADAAEQIVELLNQAQLGQNVLSDQNRPLEARDIAILVRDRHEANVMQQALVQRRIGAVFLSRDSVLATDEAREMLFILTALLTPRNEQAIRSALACRLLGFSAERIHEFNHSEAIRSDIMDQFLMLHEHWQRRGIMPALLLMADQFQLLERLSNEPNAERRLTDFRHLAELLQQKAAEIDGMNALLNWFQQSLTQSNNGEEQQLRLASEQNLVQITTIHKSKGLEYPVCFIPFCSLARDHNRRPSPMLYHQDNQLIWDLNGTDEGWQQHRMETLAEDIRLLYVALTRSVYRCYLSIANHSRMNKTGINSFLKDTAIGYLLGITDKNCDANQLAIAITKWTQVEPKASLKESWITPDQQITELTINAAKSSELSALTPATRDNVMWRIGSYSGLVKHLPHEHTTPGAGDENLTEETTLTDTSTESIPSRFSFDRGANAGSFMHTVLELIDFTQADQDLTHHLPNCMVQFGINPDWQIILHQWYLDLLDAPLTLTNETSLTLSQLSADKKLVEMEFYLPLGSQSNENQLKDSELTRLLNQFGYHGTLKFDSFKGMLKGFIDLTFEFDGKFFIADYKSNHLGDNIHAYSQQNMAEAITEHRYDLQYILYTLALHRYLAMKLDDYNYETHIGGCFYLFLRGMSATQNGSGVYFDKPDKALIMSLDQLLLGTSPNTQQTQMELTL